LTHLLGGRQSPGSPLQRGSSDADVTSLDVMRSRLALAGEAGGCTPEPPHPAVTAMTTNDEMIRASLMLSKRPSLEQLVNGQMLLGAGLFAWFSASAFFCNQAWHRALS
jgi:hypothetical protein